ncbi:N-acetyltransferase [Streptomyces sp. 1-11]|uniref:N-acetyltransferase n=1 Tax=Streptomyces sp. 1-11 TaxID=2590549 RepID=UPI0035A39B7E
MNGAYGGQGIGGPLARFPLDAARAAGFSVLPVCPFSSGWIARPPEYRDPRYHLAGERDEEPSHPTRIHRHPDGTLHVRGDLRIEAATGSRHETRAIPCGCGASATSLRCFSRHCRSFAETSPPPDEPRQSVSPRRPGGIGIPCGREAGQSLGADPRWGDTCRTGIGQGQ